MLANIIFYICLALATIVIFMDLQVKDTYNYVRPIPYIANDSLVDEQFENISNKNTTIGDTVLINNQLFIVK
jgi:hypothetical protein